MDCFFGAVELPDPEAAGKSAVVIFHIPDVGIRFKAPFAGVDKNHNDLASLLALLEFIDSNQKYFSNHTFSIYGDNLNLINQLNGREAIPDEFLPLFEKTVKYRQKYRFSVDWIPSRDNSVFDSLFD